MSEVKPKIYAFINSGEGTDWIIVVALADDGHCLASHCSSSEGWAKHDIGIGSDWKHDIYNEAYPDGWELVWVEHPLTHEGLLKAYELNQQLQKSATE
jgi:hypothetical protein